MDAALLRERDVFKKRAFATPSVEVRKKKDSGKPSSSGEPPKKKPKNGSSTSSSGSSAAKSKGSINPLNYKTMQGSSQYRFGMLAKIVKYMKQRHLEGDTHPLSIEEILDETNQLDVGSKQRHWLITEALVSNPKIIVTPDGKYAFKPAYNIKDKKALLRLLDKHDQRGYGGILLEDIQESLHNADKALKLLGDSVVVVTRPVDKKKVLFYNDKSCQITVDEVMMLIILRDEGFDGTVLGKRAYRLQFVIYPVVLPVDEMHQITFKNLVQKLWRSVAVDGIDDSKIEEYLEKQGITSMQDQGIKKITPIQRKRKGGQKKARNFKRHNEHMGDILQDYSDK